MIPTQWDFSRPDWVNRLEAGKSLMPDLPLDEELAEEAVRIFNGMRLPDVPELPYLRDAAGDWFRDIVRALFGSLFEIDGRLTRMVPSIFCLCPKKNSKTSYSAALMLTALLLNKRPRAEFLFIGPTQDIADEAFLQAEGMVLADERLAGGFEVIGHKKMIRHRRSKAFLRIKSFDGKVLTGSKPAGVLLDEIHILGAKHDATQLISQIRGGMASKPDAFLLIITTQSFKPPAGVFKKELNAARKIRDGEIEGRTLPILYEFPEAVQRSESKAWADPKIWHQVMPNLGRSLYLEDRIAHYNEEKAKGLEEEQIWASQHLNIEIGLALKDDAWPGAEHWSAATDPGLTLDELLERSEVVTVGIDGGGLDDLLGLYVLGRDAGSRAWLGWCHTWAHESVLKLRKDIAPRLRDFEADGDLTIWREKAEDVEGVQKIMRRIIEAGLLPAKSAVGLDQAGIASIYDGLAELDLTDEQLVAVPQGYRLNGTIKGAARKLWDGSLEPADQPIMKWCVGNAKTELRGNAMIITKQASGVAKIDPLQAMFDAFDLMARNPPSAAPIGSVYEEGAIYA